MGTWYAQNGAGNMSTRTWNDQAGGGGNTLVWNNQVAGDIFEANGQTAIAIDVDPKGTGGSAGTVTLKTLSGGGFTYATATNITMTMHVVAGTTPCVVISGSTGGCTITGNSTGGSAGAAYGISSTHTVITVNVGGNILGGSS